MLYNKMENVLNVDDTLHIINEASTTDHYLLGYKSFFHASEICNQSSPITNSDSNLTLNKKSTSMNNDSSNSLEQETSDISAESCYLYLSNASDSSVNFNNSEIDPPEYSVSTGSKPLSLIIRRCPTPVKSSINSTVKEGSKILLRRGDEGPCETVVGTEVNAKFSSAANDVGLHGVVKSNPVSEINTMAITVSTGKEDSLHRGSELPPNVPIKTIGNDVSGYLLNSSCQDEITTPLFTNIANGDLHVVPTPANDGKDSTLCESSISLHSPVNVRNITCVPSVTINNLDNVLNIAEISQNLDPSTQAESADETWETVGNQSELVTLDGNCIPKESNDSMVLASIDGETVLETWYSNEVLPIGLTEVNQVSKPENVFQNNINMKIGSESEKQLGPNSNESNITPMLETYCAETLFSATSFPVNNFELYQPSKLETVNENYVTKKAVNESWVASTRNKSNSVLENCQLEGLLPIIAVPLGHSEVNQSLELATLIEDVTIKAKSEKQLTLASIKNNAVLETYHFEASSPVAAESVNRSQETSVSMNENDVIIKSEITVPSIESDALKTCHFEEVLATVESSDLSEVCQPSECKKNEENFITLKTENGTQLTKRNARVFLVRLSHLGELVSTVEVPVAKLPEINTEISLEPTCKDNQTEICLPGQEITEAAETCLTSIMSKDVLQCFNVETSNKFDIHNSVLSNNETELNNSHKIQNQTCCPQTLGSSITKTMCGNEISLDEEYSENSPLLFSSDDESSFNTGVVVEEEEEEGKQEEVYSVSSDCNKTLLFEQLRLNRLQVLLTGVLPPPSVTIPQYSASDILKRLRENHTLMSSEVRSENREREIQHKSSSIKPYSTNEEVLSCDWPRVKACRYHDIYYNNGVVSEEFEYQCQRLQQRFVGCETSSTCNIWYSSTHESDANSARCKRRAPGHSPGRRLSHLARRRRAFSSSNLQNSVAGKLPGNLHQSTSERRMIMMEIKRNESRKSKNSQTKKNVVNNNERRKLSHSKLNSSKRALFQSPTEVKKTTHSSSKSKVKSRNETDRTKIRHSRRALFPDSSNVGISYQVSSDSKNVEHPMRSSVNMNGKRHRDDNEEPSRKWPHKLSSCSAGGSSGIHQPMHSNASYKSDDSDETNDSVSEAHHDPTLSKNSNKDLSANHKKKLLWAVAEALKGEGISLNHPLFRRCASSLASMCRRHLLDLLEPRAPQQDRGSTSERMLKLANKYVTNVVRHQLLKENTS